MDSQRSVKPHVVGHVWTVDIPVALHLVDAVEGVDLLRPRVVDPVGEDELAEVDVERPASARGTFVVNASYIKSDK